MSRLTGLSALLESLCRGDGNDAEIDALLTGVEGELGHPLAALWLAGGRLWSWSGPLSVVSWNNEALMAGDPTAFWPELERRVAGLPVAFERSAPHQETPTARVILYGADEPGPLARETVRQVVACLALVARSDWVLRALSANLLHTQSILDTAVDAILTIDDRGRIQSANQGAERMFGYPASELNGRNISMLMPEGYAREHDGYIANYLRTGQRKIIGIGRQVQACRRNGEVFDIHLAVTQVDLPGGRFFTGFIRDLTDLAEARQQLTAVEARLEQQAREHERREQEVKTKAILHERQHLARELHDSVSQALYGIVLGARTALAHLQRSPARVGEPLEYILSLAESGLAEMRALLYDLRPDSLHKEGLVKALSKHVAALSKRYELEFALDLGEEPEATPEVKHALHRLTMEAIHNVVKHAGASRIHLSLKGSPLGVEIEDDGCGFLPSEVPPGRLGLQSMRERIAQLGGRLTVESAPGQGTRIRAELPGR